MTESTSRLPSLTELYEQTKQAMYDAYDKGNNEQARELRRELIKLVNFTNKTEIK